MHKLVALLLLLIYLHQARTQSGSETKIWPDEEETNEYWNNKAQNDLKTTLKKELLNLNVAKNVIMFLGDGMGVPTVTAGRILKGQLNNQTGEEYQLTMEKFPHVALSKTYCIDRATPDSAATATAYLSGVKTVLGAIGVDGSVVRGDCAGQKGKSVKTFPEEAYEEGKSIGVVTTAHVAHASPAGTYAHTADRSWYTDSDLPQEAVDNGCKDIALQFLESSDMFTVSLSGGRKYFTPNDFSDPEYPNRNGDRKDGRNLIQEWIDKAGGGDNREYVWKKEQFDAIDPVTTDKLLGMFDTSHMKYEVDRANDTGGEPSIAEMTEKAIQMLQKNSKGYFLFVEGGKIDLGHHDTSAYSALYDTVAFDDAIQRAVEMTSDSDTLIIVTADHSHVMSLGGYTYRGNPIFGLAPSNDNPDLALDDKPYTSLLYGNGVGYMGVESISRNTTRTNITERDTGARLYLQQSAVPRGSETHAGEDVAIFARGPMAHLFHGIHEQTYIASVMRYATCIGSNKEHCNRGSQELSTTKTAQSSSIGAHFLGYELTIEEASDALYVQFVLVICLFLFTVILAVLLRKNQPKTSAHDSFKESDFFVNGGSHIYEL